MSTDELTLPRITEIVRELDPDLDEGSSAFDTAVLLLSLLGMWPPFTNARVSEFTGQDPERVATVMRRLRASGVVRPKTGAGDELHAGWFDDETGDTAFWLDVNVGEGKLKRVPSEA